MKTFALIALLVGLAWGHAWAGEKLILGQQEIVELSDTVGSFQPKDRVREAEHKLHSLVESGDFDARFIHLEASPGVARILYKDQILISLTDKDASALGVKTEELAASVESQLKEALQQSHKSYSNKSLLMGGVYTLISLFILIGFLILISRVAKRLDRQVSGMQEQLKKFTRFKNFNFISEVRMVRILRGMIDLLRLAMSLIVLYIFVPLVLSFFPWTQNLSQKIVSYVMDPLQQIWAVTIDYIPKLFFLIVIFFISRFLLKVIHLFFIEIERGNIQFSGFYREWARPTYMLVRLLIIAFALVVAFPYLPGSGSPAFQGISVFLGVLVSFGSSSAIGNIVSGIVLTYMRPFQIGDVVCIAGNTGLVIEKGLLVSRIRTMKNEEITIPNAQVLNGHIINYSQSENGGVILHTKVTIGYSVPWATVHRLLLEAAERTAGILKGETQKPFVLQTALDDFYVNYEINAYTNEADKMPRIYSELHQNIQNAFKEAGVEIMSPHYRAHRDGNESTVPK